MQPFLNRCAEVEETLAQIYTELAVTVAAEQTLKNIWLAMADDEGEHAREIRMAVRMLKEDIVVGEQVPDAEIRQLLAQARDLLAKVRQSESCSERGVASVPASGRRLPSGAFVVRCALRR